IECRQVHRLPGTVGVNRSTRGDGQAYADFAPIGCRELADGIAPESLAMTEDIGKARQPYLRGMLGRALRQQSDGPGGVTSVDGSQFHRPGLPAPLLAAAPDETSFSR